MVRFIDPNENDPSDDESSDSAAAEGGDKLATVSYLPGATAHREFAEVTPEVDPESVEAALVKKLARRALSESEILSYGMGEGLTAHQANSVLDHLRDLGYVDDRVLAEQLKHALYERKGQSKSVVARAMSGRSIDREIIDEVLDDIDSGDELAAATELAAKRASQLTGLDKQTLERRLVGFLARRGYPGTIVREAIAPLLTGRSNSASSTVRFR
ncbi:regulatory protein RecX [Mycetocola sp.]|uniref:regulatory protein RecX n=1 Tax=Mycetocola sp. TaxID=1871042 RepID=UPI0039897F63